jgi:hypothetical protein
MTYLEVPVVLIVASGLITVYKQICGLFRR